MEENLIRNVAIIAHVDHGKTTLVDALLRQSKTKLGREVIDEICIMDSNEIEKERGITIFSKNAAIEWKGVKINIIDTPGHADFGGEVERVLSMADGCLLLIDAKEGPMPQTRFVLRRALEKKLKVIVIINKIDKPDARPDFALNKTFDLFIELGADEETAYFPVVYASARDGKAGLEPDLSKMTDINPIFDAILKYIPAPAGDPNKPLQLMVTSTIGDNFKGRLGIGRICNGVIHAAEDIARVDRNGMIKTFRLTSLMTYNGLDKEEVKDAITGDVVAFAGIPDITIGETITDVANPQALPALTIEQPTMQMTFAVNDSPFAGKEGEFVTSRQLRERLYRELESDVALRVEDDAKGGWTVSGRGELHLAIFIERLRREGYEFQVARPRVIDKIVDGKRLTPYETVYIEVPEASSGIVMQKLLSRHAELVEMTPQKDGTVFFEFLIPTKGLFGYRSEFTTDTHGLGMFNSSFDSYKVDPGNWKEREQGSLVASDSGITHLYGLTGVQARGILFYSQGVQVYRGEVVGQNARPGDIRVNVCKEKQLSNMRSRGEGVAEHFNEPKIMPLEAALEYIGEDELVEVTPKNIRIRKIILDMNEEKRKKAMGQASKLDE